MYFKNKLKLLSLSLSLVVFGLLSACGDTATVANPVSTTVANPVSSAVVTTAAVSTSGTQVSTVAGAVVSTAGSTVAGATVTYGSGRGATIIAGLPTP
ncbi:MAG: hypothetical protein HXX20_19275, partial [Chloroflexi bacterium]|nr:hypothetical protein [Chloroflexota bacterium]